MLSEPSSSIAFTFTLRSFAFNHTGTVRKKNVSVALSCLEVDVCVYELVPPSVETPLCHPLCYPVRSHAISGDDFYYNHYYMATIVRALWLATERAFFSCNDGALWNFFSAQRLFWVVSKAMSALAKTTTTKKDGQRKTIFSITWQENLSSIRDEEGHMRATGCGKLLLVFLLYSFQL